jgi:16S rRNA G966 N2-methylase RsmD
MLLNISNLGNFMKNQNFDWIRRLNLNGRLYRSPGVGSFVGEQKQRNAFYEHMISHECPGKICYDIGAGNGLLTILALKHGAQHVYAFERDVATAEFFQNIIYGLNLQDKVTLIEDDFALSKLSSYNIAAPNVIMHYLRHGSDYLNDGGVLDAFDTVTNDIEFLPGYYGIEIREVAINDKVYLDLLAKNNNFSKLETGISGITDFENLYTEFVNKFYEIDLRIALPPHLESLVVSNSKFLASCYVDIKNQAIELNTDTNSYTFSFPLIVPSVQVPTKNEKSIIICDFYVKYKEKKVSYVGSNYLLKSSASKNVEINLSNSNYIWLS